MWLSSSACPNRPSKIVVIRPPPFPLRHLCLVAVCHGDVCDHTLGLSKGCRDLCSSLLSKLQGVVRACRVHLGTPWKLCHCLHLYANRF